MLDRDGSEELLELLDDEGKPLGRGKRRDEVHRDGDWHRAFHLWVARPNDHVLLQRRSKKKDIAPGKVDVSVGGHVRLGETLRDAVREADEEIGLVVAPGDIAYLGTFRSERRYDAAVDREFQDVYAVFDDRGIREFRMPCDEVTVLYEAPLDRLIALYRGELRYLPVAGYDCQDRVNDALLIEDDLIEPARVTTAACLERVREWCETALK